MLILEAQLFLSSPPEAPRHPVTTFVVPLGAGAAAGVVQQQLEPKQWPRLPGRELRVNLLQGKAAAAVSRATPLN